MKINIKARLKNKTFLISFSALAIAFVYQILSLFGFTPEISENEVVNVFSIVINILACVGVIVDPTTEGMNDSDRAMTYFTDYDERLID
ncbi:MAG: phage holin [Clostridia bacterium]|nr:phage holin [Clostridia bacterium]MBO5433308.1 phage holin [Clostridia bacterium]